MQAIAARKTNDPETKSVISENYLNDKVGNKIVLQKLNQNDRDSDKRVPHAGVSSREEANIEQPTLRKTGGHSRATKQASYGSKSSSQIRSVSVDLDMVIDNDNQTNKSLDNYQRNIELAQTNDARGDIKGETGGAATAMNCSITGGNNPAQKRLIYFYDSRDNIEEGWSGYDIHFINKTLRKFSF